MECNLVFLLGHKDNTVKILALYSNKVDANNNLEKCALDYIKEMQGLQQSKICKPGDNKTPDQVFKDISFKEGMYIFTINETKIALYEKINVIAPGTLWGKSQTLQMNKIGEFGITEFSFDNCFCENGSKLKTHSNQVPVPPKLPVIKNSQNMNMMIQELKDKLQEGNGQFKLKSQKVKDELKLIIINDKDIDIDNTKELENNTNKGTVEMRSTPYLSGDTTDDKDDEDVNNNYKTLNTAFKPDRIKSPKLIKSKKNKVNKVNKFKCGKDDSKIILNLPLFPSSEEEYEPVVSRTQSFSELPKIIQPSLMRSNSDTPLILSKQNLVLPIQNTKLGTEEITLHENYEQNNMELDKTNVCQQ